MEATKNIEKINEVVENTLPTAEEIVVRTGLGKGGKIAGGIALVVGATWCVTKVYKHFKNKKKANDEFEGDEGVEESVDEDFDAEA